MIGKILIVFLVSMIPLIELRGAIPVAIGLDLGLPEWLVLITAIVGNILPVPLIYIFARRFLEWGSRRAKQPSRSKSKNIAKTTDEVESKHRPNNFRASLARFCQFCLTKGEKAGKKLTSKAGNSVYLALFLFVAIPLPGTGAWTGTLAASLLGLSYKRTVIAISLGILVAGTIMLAASMGVVSVLR